MAKQPLATKYRPQSFDDLSEQTYVKDILTYQLETETFQHAYLFSGRAGSGKTTSGRIFAKMINNSDNNIIEIDAASNSGVDNIRNVIDDARKKPLGTPYKVFLLDEVHALSSGSWQALLKLLEESPKFAIFIMCTTDPQKIPDTILSRVQRYNFTNISVDGIKKRLEYIIEQENELGENITFEDQAIDYLAKMARGGMRTAITSLDKCLSLSTNITLDNVLNTLGCESTETMFELANKLLNRDMTCVSVIEQVANSGKDVKIFMKDFSKFVLDLCKYKLYNNFKYIDIAQTAENASKIDSIIKDDIYGLVDLTLKTLNTSKYEQDAKTMIELVLLSYAQGGSL